MIQKQFGLSMLYYNNTLYGYDIVDNGVVYRVKREDWLRCGGSPRVKTNRSEVLVERGGRLYCDGQVRGIYNVVDMKDGRIIKRFVRLQVEKEIAEAKNCVVSSEQIIVELANIRSSLSLLNDLVYGTYLDDTYSEVEQKVKGYRSPIEYSFDEMISDQIDYVDEFIESIGIDLKVVLGRCKAIRNTEAYTKNLAIINTTKEGEVRLLVAISNVIVSSTEKILRGLRDTVAPKKCERLKGIHSMYLVLNKGYGTYYKEYVHTNRNK